MSVPDRIVDARGLLCPWPVVRLIRAAREAVGPVRIRLLADDPAASADVAQLCRERRWSFAADPTDSQAFSVIIG